MLDTAKENISDPEAREVCAAASAMLSKKAAGAVQLKFDVPYAEALLKKTAGDFAADKAVFANQAAHQASTLNEVDCYDSAAWVKSLSKTLVATGALEQKKAEEVIEVLRKDASQSKVVVEEEEIDEGAEVLCDLPFGLAYGNKVLMRKTKLKLLRGHKYGLLGQNDSGKTSLLKALADYKIEGFPSADVCRTVFVETDIKAELADLTVIEYMFNDPLLKDSGRTKDEMEKMLNSVGFRQGSPANT